VWSDSDLAALLVVVKPGQTTFLIDVTQENRGQLTGMINYRIGSLCATSDCNDSHQPDSDRGVIEKLGPGFCDVCVHCYNMQINAFDMQFSPQDRNDSASSVLGHLVLILIFLED